MAANVVQMNEAWAEPSQKNRLLLSLSFWTGVEESAMKESWLSDRDRAIWLLIGMGFLFALQWLIWSVVFRQIMGWMAAIVVGLFPPIGLLIFDRLVILPSLWDITQAQLREKLNLPPMDWRKQALAMAMRLVVSLVFAWVAAEYLTLAREAETLERKIEQTAKVINKDLIAEYSSRQKTFDDAVAAALKSSSQTRDQIDGLRTTRAQSERNLITAQQTAANAKLEKDRQKEGVGDRVEGEGKLYRDAEREESNALAMAARLKDSLSQTDTDLLRLQGEHNRLEGERQTATTQATQAKNDIKNELRRDPRYVNSAFDLMSRRIALEELKADAKMGAVINRYIFETELVVIFLDLLLFFGKFAPHHSSYAMRLECSRRLESEKIIQKTNQAAVELRGQRPEIRIVREA